MEKSTKVIAFDAGGYLLEPAIKGAINALLQNSRNPPRIILVGKGEKIAPKIKGHESFISIEDAQDFIEDGDDYSNARTRKDSSLYKATDLVRQGKADGVISFSNTAAVTTIFTVLLGRIEGIKRPATACIWPGDKPTIFLDSGGVVDCSPEDLVQFARMGTIMAEKVLGISDPKVGLLSVGEEKSKGDKFTLTTHALLLATKDINFQGNCEGYDMLLGNFDVIVTDGQAGNIALKSAESVMKLIKLRTKKHRLKAIFAIPFLNELKKELDPSQYGGASSLGTKKDGIIGHGKSNALACQRAIEWMQRYLEVDLVGEISSRLPSLVMPTLEN